MYHKLMPRIPRIIIPNVPYHVAHRGNHQIDVFYNSSDREKYLNWLNQYSSIYQFDILAYCLMTNHVHFVGIPRKSDSIARTIQVVHVRHAQKINRQKGWSGNLWQQRYFACALDDPHMWLAIRYVEQNSIRAGIVVKAEDYKWSSAAYHCGLRDDPVIVHNDKIMGMFDGWSEVVNQVIDDEKQKTIRTRTYKGIPLGDDRFTKRIFKMIDQKGRKINRGRPRNTDK